MPITAGVGFSQNIDAAAAAQEAAKQARMYLREERIDLALLFHTVHYQPQDFLATVYATLDQTKIIGSSTAGIILADRVETRGIAVLALNADHIKFEAGHVSHLNFQDMHSAGRTLAKNAITDFGHQHRKMFVFFTDGLLEDISGLIGGIKEQLGGTFPVFGAGSSDDFHFQNTHQHYLSQSMTKGAVGILLGGRIRAGISCQHAYRPLGKPRIIDKVENNIIKSIDGKPALSIYEEYFDKEAETLRAKAFGQINIRYPLGIITPHNHEYLVRNVVRVLDDKSIVCQDNIVENSEVHIMIGNEESCLQSAEEAAKRVKEQLKNQKARVILILESLARYRLLGRNAFKEAQVIRKILGSAPIIGMYSYGEIFTTVTSPKTAPTHLQNGSMIILALS